MATLNAAALDVKTTINPGGAMDVRKLSDLCVYFVNLGGGLVVQLQVSPDGINWFDAGAPVNASGQVQLATPCALFLRANTTNGGTLGAALVVGEPSARELEMVDGAVL